ncbi:phage integrase N-terminal SAM-like domain-containing protein [Nitrosomonas communis]|uniref:phage integrase N-terminal SAM-like domain-containing protein n=1 Tax=Nitrosomonas communis TaxID=44574 RepID=UPI0034E989F1|nr:phage integrase N-terminal SAM-like domain-containing protein [Nitrosomonas communis]
MDPWKTNRHFWISCGINSASTIIGSSDIIWIKCFIIFTIGSIPDAMEEKEIESLLSYLAIKRNAAASTENQALRAFLFASK